MLSSRLTARCSSAKVIGIASAQCHALEFSKESIDGSGKATLVVGTDTVQTPGVLFEIEEGERDALDKFEGAGKGYDRVDEFRVATSDETITTTTYLASARQSNLIPFDWYLALVMAGVLEHELGDVHADRLRAIMYASDESVLRKSRAAALEALARHGYDDHKTLLRNYQRNFGKKHRGTCGP